MNKSKVKYPYYHERILNTFKFLVAPHKKILFYSCQDGQKLFSLHPNQGVGIENNPILFQKLPSVTNMTFIQSVYENYQPKNKYDYIILYGTIGKTQNIMKLLQNLRIACKPTTRIIVYQHNYLWQGILKFLEKMNMKLKENVYNWLSLADVNTYLHAAGFDTTRIFRHTLCPLYLFGLGPLINSIATIIPFFDFLKLDQFIIARPLPEILPNPKHQLSLSICITVRDEIDNIEPIVRSLPKLAPWQEIIFIEGHSQDGTKEEIQRIITKYPQKNIKLIIQPGFGQGDATRIGFNKAKGSLIFIYEGDGTAAPSDLIYFYQAMTSGRFEFMLGSRLVYPLTSQTMPVLNKIGNKLFATWFSFFLGQQTTDVLCGIKSIAKKNYDIINEHWGFLGINDPFGDFELLFGAARMGLKIGEIPVHYLPRTYGHSKTKIWAHGWYLFKMAARGYWLFRSQ